MNRSDIEAALREAVGDPTSGVVAEVIPAMTEAMARLLGLPPQGGSPEQRIVEAVEVR